MKNLIVSDEYFNLIESNDIDYIIDTSLVRKDLINSNSKWSEPLKKYIILTYGKGKIPSLTPETLYTSRYFWMELFYFYYEKEYGKDVGIEQQIGKIIEEMANNTLDVDYDWNILELISTEIKKGNYQNLLNSDITSKK